ncbi:hypothetical protein GCM10009605_29890 [Nocardiopsis composta]
MKPRARSGAGARSRSAVGPAPALTSAIRPAPFPVPPNAPPGPDEATERCASSPMGLRTVFG